LAPDNFQEKSSLMLLHDEGVPVYSHE